MTSMLKHFGGIKAYLNLRGDIRAGIIQMPYEGVNTHVDC